MLSNTICLPFPSSPYTPSANSEKDMSKRLQKRSDVFSNALSFESFLSSKLKEEVCNLKKQREEIFSLKRSKNELENIPVLSRKEAIKIKEQLEDTQNEEEYKRNLHQIILLNKRNRNIKTLTEVECPSVITQKFIQIEIEREINQDCVMTLTSFCHKDFIQFYSFKPAVVKICDIIKNMYTYEEFYLKMLLYIVSFCCDNFSKKTVRIILKQQMVRIIMTFLDSNNCFSEEIQLYSIRILGNICTSSNKNTQAVIDVGLIKLLRKLLIHQNQRIRKDATWIVSNLAVGSKDQIDSLTEEDLFPLMKEIFYNDVTPNKKEAVWAICNLSNTTNPYYVETLIEQGIIEILYELLFLNSPRFIILSLEALYNLMEIESIFLKSTDFHPNQSLLKTKLIPLGFLEKLESLQFHPNQVVYERVSAFIDKHLINIDEEDLY